MGVEVPLMGRTRTTQPRIVTIGSVAARRLAELRAEEARVQNVGDTRPAWSPHQGPQREFYESDCDEVLYGGSAGGGKSFAAVALPVEWIGLRDYRALILRRETPQLEDLWDKAKKIYKNGESASSRPFKPACVGANFTSSPSMKVAFPSGAIVYFDHCKNEDDWEKYQGREFHDVVFDELTHFTERQYLEIKSRLRSATPGLPRRARATTNPGSAGHEWVFKRWRYWLDPEAEIPGRQPRYDAQGKRLPPASPGEVLWLKKGDDDCEVVTTKGDCQATSRTFIPARLEDNPTLLAEDPGYRNRLRDFGRVRREQLENGNWLIKPAAGLYFKREWFEFIDAHQLPKDRVVVRAWDLAATEPNPAYPDPDWTVGLKFSKDANAHYYIEHVVRFRGAPGAVDALVRNTAKSDGTDVVIRLPQDPGQAGKSQSASHVQMLDGFDVTVRRESGDKETRAGPVSSQASPQSTGGTHGRISIVRGEWNEAFLNVLQEFPDARHDDDVDALAAAHDEMKDRVVSAGIHVIDRSDLIDPPRFGGGRGF